jgi:sterol desaturase/sphingolipid hydroxylase (fatty acid hydroxylase superfamily)
MQSTTSSISSTINKLPTFNEFFFSLQSIWTCTISYLGQDAITHPLSFTISILFTVVICGGLFSFWDVFITRKVPWKTSTLYFFLTIPGYFLAYAFIWNPIQVRLPLMKEAPTLLEFIFGIAMCFIVADITSYWWHRLEHSNKFIWNHVHYLHHSYEETLSVWSGLYVHPVESAIVFMAFYYYPFACQFIDKETFGVWGMFWIHPLTFHIYSAMGTAVQLITHCGYDLYWWIYPSVFASFPMHQLHHSKRLRKSHSGGISTKNFCVMLRISDQIWGTYKEPELHSGNNQNSTGNNNISTSDDD